MTYFYSLSSSMGQPQTPQITEETIKAAEAAIDGSVDHYGKKVDFLKGPKVVKTFK